MRWKWMLAVGAFLAMAVTAVVLLAWFIPRHREPVLLNVCWAGTVAQYTDQVEGHTATGVCARPSEVLWERNAVPLCVQVSSAGAAPSVADTRRAEAAVREVNRQLGFDALAFCPAGETRVLLELGVAAEADDPDADCFHVRDVDSAFVANARVRVRNVPDEATAHRVIVHELGHALGLAHDPDDSGSVMYPLAPDLVWSGDIARVRFTDADVAGLRDLYEPRADAPAQ